MQIMAKNERYWDKIKTLILTTLFQTELESIWQKHEIHHRRRKTRIKNFS